MAVLEQLFLYVDARNTNPNQKVEQLVNALLQEWVLEELKDKFHGSDEMMRRKKSTETGRWRKKTW